MVSQVDDFLDGIHKPYCKFFRIQIKILYLAGAAGGIPLQIVPEKMLDGDFWNTLMVWKLA